MKIISAFIILLWYIPFRSSYAQSEVNDVQTIEYFCTADSSYQKALYYMPNINEPAPLLVALHSWSSDYTNPNYVHYADYCIENGWVFIHPDFRGKNDNPDATGSSLAVKDIIDAVRFAESNSMVDTSRIYLAGASGGGHAALLTAGKYPGIWAGVSAWVPITDLVRWYTETKDRGLKYWQDIYNSCGGDPTSDSTAYIEAWKRSPINFLEYAKEVPVDINAGINDGHDNFSVPVSHSLYAFNKLADPSDTLPQEDIDFFVTNAGVPPSLTDESENDSLYENKTVLFRRSSGNVRITIFDGGHEIIYNAACEWLSAQVKGEPTGIAGNNHAAQPELFILEQNHPNPFNPTTTIEYSIPGNSWQLTVDSKQNRVSNSQYQESSIGNQSSNHSFSQSIELVQLKIYDILGREVATLVNKAQAPGNYSVRFNAGSFADGIYIYTLTAGRHSESRKMILIK